MQGSTENVSPRRVRPSMALEADAVHPARRAGVPGPAAAADVRRVRVDVRRDHVGLGLVALDARRRVRVWLMGFSMWNISIASSPLPRRASAITVQMRGVGVLPAVLAHAGRVAPDVAGIGASCWSKGGVSSRMQPRVAAHQVRAHRVHRALGPRGRAAPDSTAQRLRDGVDPALLVLGRAERRAVVEVGAPIPLAVPGQLQHVAPGAPPRVGSGPRARRRRAARTAARTSRSTSQRNKPSQTLSPRPPCPTRFMPSFQSPVPISGSPCGPAVSPRSIARRQCSYSGRRSPAPTVGSP